MAGWRELTRREVLALGSVVGLAACSARLFGTGRGPVPPIPAVMVPMEVIHATPCVPLTVVGPAGERTVRCHLDTGGGAVLLRDRLAADLQLAKGPTLHEQDGTYPTVHPRALRLDTAELDFQGVMVATQGAEFFARTGAEAFLPARVLSRYHVVFDYPADQFHLSPAASSHPQGATIAGQVSSHRFVRVEMTVGDASFGVLVDTGASHTMVSARLFDRWHAQHPDWPVTTAALGTANMAIPAADKGQRMMRIPEARVGPLVVHDLSVVTRPAGTYENYMSPLMSQPILGALAGNVLEHLRVGIDYQRSTLDVFPSELTLPASFVAPFSIAPSPTGYTVLDTTADAAGLRPGDRITAIDGNPTINQTFAAVVTALTADTPATRTITIDRNPPQNVTVSLERV